MIKIKNNFLPKQLLKEINYLVTDYSFPWYYHPFVVDDNIKGKEMYFTHILFREDMVNSSFYEKIMSNFLKKLNIKKLKRAKLNLYPFTNKLIKHGWHTDSEISNKVALFYLNENNGFTFFKNPNKKIESNSNKCVLFDSDTVHRSTNCTDTLCRITLNINYD